jgi:site-specific recombinase XerD
MLQGGMDLETVRDVLGHESVTTTELCLHTTSERKKRAAEVGSLLSLVQ